MKTSEFGGDFDLEDQEENQGKTKIDLNKNGAQANQWTNYQR